MKRLAVLLALVVVLCGAVASTVTAAPTIDVEPTLALPPGVRAPLVVATDPGGYGYYNWPISYPSCGMFDIGRFGKTYAVFSMVTYRPEERLCRWYGWQSGSRVAYGHPPGWHDDGYWGGY